MPRDKACHQPGKAVARWAARDSVSMTCAERDRDRGECRPSEQSDGTQAWGGHPKGLMVWAGEMYLGLFEGVTLSSTPPKACRQNE